MTVTVVMPAGVAQVVVIVSVPLAGLAPGVNDGAAHDAPVGRYSVQVIATALLKPPEGVTVTVEVVELPATTEAGRRGSHAEIGSHTSRQLKGCDLHYPRVGGRSLISGCIKRSGYGWEGVLHVVPTAGEQGGGIDTAAIGTSFTLRSSNGASRGGSAKNHIADAGGTNRAAVQERSRSRSSNAAIKWIRSVGAAVFHDPEIRAGWHTIELYGYPFWRPRR